MSVKRVLTKNKEEVTVMKLKDLLRSSKEDTQEVEKEADAGLKKVIEAKDAAKRAMNEGNELIAKLTAKLDVLETDLPQLKEKISVAEAARQRMIDLVAMDKASQTELEKTREELEEAKKAVVEAVEMISAVSRNKDKAAENLSRLSNMCSATDRAFWALIRDDIKAEIVSVVGRKAEYAWAANAGSGGTRRTDAIGWIFSLHQPPHERLREVLNELEALYREKAR